MTAPNVTFGWVLTPSAPAHLADQFGGPSGLTTQLIADDRAFIEKLPAPFSTLWVEDHFQWGADPTLEAFATMTYFATLYPAFRMGSIVLGQSYRNSALTAKMAATLQVLTGGRFILGLGAGWKEDEYAAYGYDYPSIGTRIEQLDEALAIVRAMFTQSPASYMGRHYRIAEAYNEPRPQPAIPILVGGGGEQKTLRVVARHADMWNGNFLTPDAFAHKQAVLAEHCRAIGRDPSTIEHTYYGFLDLSDAQDTSKHPDVRHVLHGTTRQVADELQAFISLGVRHIMLRFLDFPSTTGLERFTREVLPALRLDAGVAG